MAKSKKNYVVGAEIDAYCTKCKIDRQHAIETLKSDGNINRVVCHTCQGSHLFRRPKAEQKKRTTKSTRRPAGAVTVTEEQLADAKPYAIDGIFEAGDIILHSKFGPGSVTRVKAGGKMEVGFETGPKLMLCGSGSPFGAQKRETRRARPKKAAAPKAPAKAADDEKAVADKA